jgi:hypothetical protein
MDSTDLLRTSYERGPRSNGPRATLIAAMSVAFLTDSAIFWVTLPVSVYRNANLWGPFSWARGGLVWSALACCSTDIGSERLP